MNKIELCLVSKIEKVKHFNGNSVEAIFLALDTKMSAFASSSVLGNPAEYMIWNVLTKYGQSRD